MSIITRPRASQDSIDLIAVEYGGLCVSEVGFAYHGDSFCVAWGCLLEVAAAAQLERMSHQVLFQVTKTGVRGVTEATS